jgi:hypothetical protein
MAVKAENATEAETAEPDFTANCTRRLFSPLLALFNSLVLSAREHFKIDPVTAQPTLTESATSSAEPRLFGTILYDAHLCVIAASQCLHKVVTHSEDGSPLFGTVLGRVLEKLAHCKNLMGVLHSTVIVTGYDSCRDADKADAVAALALKFMHPYSVSYLKITHGDTGSYIEHPLSTCIQSGASPAPKPPTTSSSSTTTRSP